MPAGRHSHPFLLCEVSQADGAAFLLPEGFLLVFKQLSRPVLDCWHEDVEQFDAAALDRWFPDGDIDAKGVGAMEGERQSRQRNKVASARGLSPPCLEDQQQDQSQ